MNDRERAAIGRKEWFEDWFGEDYLKLYPHRNEADARAMVELIDRTVPLGGRRVLDLACGPGRHSRAMAALGAKVTGVDLSPTLIRRAHAERGDDASGFARCDMRRLPFAPETFDLIVNLFTSFGYFANDREHEALIHDIALTLQPGGRFVLDFLNADQVIANMIARETARLGKEDVAVTRHIDEGNRFVTKTITRFDGRRHEERVRLFTKDELEAMLKVAGLNLTHEFGDYSGGSVGPSSPRVILFSERV